MYEFRTTSAEAKAQILEQRRQRRLPLHAPPHYPEGSKTYILTAACFEHNPIIDPGPRRTLVQKEIVDELVLEPWAELHAWVVLPNHYHLLTTLDLAAFRNWVRLKHCTLARTWNRQDHRKGRQVWYRFQDRAIRNERHYFATLNYIHANAVRHGYTRTAADWPWSSLGEYLQSTGRERMRQIWRDYPTDDYGNGWDW